MDEIQSKASEEVVETEIKEGSEASSSPQYTEDEQRAMERGWLPKDQWKGNPDLWRPAKDFNEKGELIGKVIAQGRELEQLKAAVNHMTVQQQKAYLAGFEAAIAQEKARRNEALEEGDLKRAQNHTDRLDDIKEQYREAKIQVSNSNAVPASNAGSDTFRDWHSRNEWYERDRAMTIVAEAEGIAFRKANRNSSEAEMLAHVEKAVRAEFPHKFAKKEQHAPNPDGEGRNTSRKSDTSAKYSSIEAQMSEQDKSIMRTIMKTTGMTKEQYLKDFSR